MKIKVTIKEELSLILVLLFFASCNYNNKINKIVDADKILKDSIVLFENNFNNRSWLKHNSDFFSILINDSLYKFDGQKQKLEKVKNLFGYNADDVFEIGNNCFYDRRSHDKRLLIIANDSIQTYPLVNSNYKYNDTNYVLQLHDYKTFVKLKNNCFLGHLLYNDFQDSKNASEYLNKLNKNRLGFFKIENNKVVLEKIINFFPRKNFLIDDNRCLDLSISICQDNFNFYLAPNFLDTIFKYNYNGELVGNISLPSSLNFKYYNNSDVKELNEKDLSNSKIMGSKNSRMYYNKLQNCLVLITLNGIDQSKSYEVLPSINELDWTVSIFNLTQNKWANIIKFDKRHDFRNVYFYNNVLFVKRNYSTKFIIDKYVY